ARELMRRIQDLRKQAGMKKTDEITLAISCSEKMKKNITVWKTQIAEKVGAKEITFSKEIKHEKQASNEFKIKEEKFSVSLEKI
ncbi:MAG: DUF5915 domain-containing protein, partial [Nanoarchaeota archaeon]|nr:DUF5915 domain-containing protein [Nanoarchaeota archaeon]